MARDRHRLGELGVGEVAVTALSAPVNKTSLAQVAYYVSYFPWHWPSSLLHNAKITGFIRWIFWLELIKEGVSGIRGVSLLIIKEPAINGRSVIARSR